MRAIVIGAVLSALLLSPPVARSDQPANPPDIAGLIQRLASAKFQDRERADRDLRRIGEPALKQLKEASQSKDIEVRERAVAAIRSIEQKIENDKLLAAPKLRLEYKNTPLDQAIADLVKKTGLKYQLDAKSSKDPKQAITLDTGDVPYWEAVEKFLAATGLMEVPPPVQANPQQGQLYFEQQQMRAFRGRGFGRGAPAQPAVELAIKLAEAKTTLPASTSTLIRVKALPKETQTSGVVKGSNQIILNLEVTPAPALAWQGVVNVDVRRVIDDRGVALAQSHTYNPVDGASNTIWADGMPIQVFQGGGQGIIIQGNVQIWTSDYSGPAAAPVNPRHVPIALLAKDVSSKVLKELQGVITAQVLTPPEPIVVIDNILKASAKDAVQKGEYHLQIEERTENNGTVQLRFRVRAPVQNNFMAFQGGRGVGVFQADGFGQMGQFQIQIQDASGTRLNVNNMQLMEQSFDGMTQTSLYSVAFPRKGSGEPAKLAVVGRRMATVDVPFSLKDVPMP